MTSLDEDHAWQLGTPLLDMNYGVGDSIQLKYQVPLAVYVPPQSGARVGMDNSLAGVKWRFLDQTNCSPFEVSTYPQVEFIYPTSSIERVDADNGDNLILPIEIERHMKQWIVYAESGYIVDQKRPPEYFYGVAAEYDFSEKFALMGELYGGYGSVFQEKGLSFNLGFRQELTEHVALIGAFGRAIFGPESGAPTFMGYLALQLTY